MLYNYIYIADTCSNQIQSQKVDGDCQGWGKCQGLGKTEGRII